MKSYKIDLVKLKDDSKHITIAELACSSYKFSVFEIFDENEDFILLKSENIRVFIHKNGDVRPSLEGHIVTGLLMNNFMAISDILRNYQLEDFNLEKFLCEQNWIESSITGIWVDPSEKFLLSLEDENNFYITKYLVGAAEFDGTFTGERPKSLEDVRTVFKLLRIPMI